MRFVAALLVALMISGRKKTSLVMSTTTSSVSVGRMGFQCNRIAFNWKDLKCANYSRS